jgi:hypothetical protein
MEKLAVLPPENFVPICWDCAAEDMAVCVCPEAFAKGHTVVIKVTVNGREEERIYALCPRHAVLVLGNST